MATISRKQDPRLNVGRTPFGNAHQLHYWLETGSAGGAISGTADSTAAIASGDKVVLGLIPGGSVLGDFTAIISVAMSASVVGTLGFEYVDGVDDADVPQDADYFGAAMVLNATGVLRKATVTKPVTLPKDANLVLVTGGAANAKASRVDILLHVASEGVL